MAVAAPPRPPAQPPGRDELEALIKEARRRQRKRQALTAAAILAAAGAGVLVYALVGHGGGSVTSNRTRTPAAAPAPVTTRFAVGASSFGRPRWGGLVLADPTAGRCTKLALPDGDGYVTFSGNRYAYESKAGPAIWVGSVRGGRPHKLVPPYRASPFWLDGRLALMDRSSPTSSTVRVGGRTLHLAAPTGAQIGVDGTSHGKILYSADWGSMRAGNYRSGLFVLAHGRSATIRNEADAAGGSGPGSASLSPRGDRVAFLDGFNGAELWVASAGGGSAVRLARSTHVTKEGPLLWSPDGKWIAFVAHRANVREVYIVRSDGSSPARRLTTTRLPAPPVDESGTVPVAWLGPDALAVVSGNALGVLRTESGPVRRIYTISHTSFSGASALR